MTHENETALGMDQDTNIALGVSAIPIIKNDILTVAGQMDAAVYDGVLSECEKKLSAKIDEVFNEFNSSNSTDKESLFEQLNTLFEGQSDMQAVITKLRNAIISLETGGEEGSVLSEETIKNVLNAALTTESFWTDDTIGASSVVGQKIIGLVGEFGEVKASSLKGDTIEGLTLQSHLKDEDDKPLWQINREGDGHLAGGNISWNDGGTIQIGSETKGLNFNSKGELTFGSDVKLSWGNVDSPSNLATTDDIPDPVSDEHISNITTTTITKDYVESLKVRATDIIGDTITGKTIQSSDNSWKIGKDGDGHLAGGNISWNDDGTIQIGSKTKGLNFNSNGELTFGSDVTLSWNKINGTDNVANKSDIPNLDDYATKDYVDQNSGGFTTEIGNNWIKTADVTCENLKVAKLDTAPTSGNNKITISGNEFQVLNDNDNPGVSISNNDISFEYSPERLDTTAVFEMTDGFLNFNRIITDGNGTIYNATEATTGAVCSLGALDYGASIGTLMCAFRLTRGSLISTSKYSLLTSNTAARPYITIYKYNNATESWESYKKIGCTSWDKVTSITSVASSSDTMMYRFSVTNVTVFERGIYGVGLTVPAGGLIFNQMITGGGIQGRVDFNIHTINRNLSTFVDIGKNGIVINSENGNIYMNNSIIQLSMGTKNSMYGIKITPSGMYYCNGGSTWTAWNPSN